MVKKYLFTLGLCLSVSTLNHVSIQKGYASATSITSEVNVDNYDIKFGQPFQIVISPTKTILSEKETISRILNAYNPESSHPFEIEINDHGKYIVEKDQCLFIDAEQERVKARGSIVAKVITYPGWSDSLLTIAHYASHPKDNIEASIEATFSSEKNLIALVGQILMNVSEEDKIYRNGASIEGIYKLCLSLQETAN